MGNLGCWNHTGWYWVAGYMTLCICQNLQNGNIIKNDLNGYCGGV